MHTCPSQIYSSPFPFKPDLQCAQHDGVPVQTVVQHTPFLSSQAVLNGFLQPPVLTEQLNQLQIHMSVSWPRCQLGLEEVEQPVPTLLTLTTQQTLLHTNKPKRVSVASSAPLIKMHLLPPSFIKSLEMICDLRSCLLIIS